MTSTLNSSMILTLSQPEKKDTSGVQNPMQRTVDIPQVVETSAKKLFN